VPALPVRPAYLCKYPKVCPYLPAKKPVIKIFSVKLSLRKSVYFAEYNGRKNGIINGLHVKWIIGALKLI
jgi:hypothetical protein